MPVEANDLPDVVASWQKRDAKKILIEKRKRSLYRLRKFGRTSMTFQLIGNKELVYKEEEYEPPMQILSRLLELERELND